MAEDDVKLLIGRLEGKMDLMVTSVNNLASSFENLEKGRLSRAEIAIAELTTKLGTNSKEAEDRAQNSAIWASVIIASLLSVAGTLFSSLMLHYWFHI